MPELLNDISLDQYNLLARDYIETIGATNGPQQLHFFAYIQKRVLTVLKEKFQKKGVKLVRDLIQEEDDTIPPAMRYKMFFIADVTKTPIPIKSLNLSSIIREVRLVDPKLNKLVPDVKIVVPEYLEAKIEEICEAVVYRFQFLFDQHLQTLKNEELIMKGLENGKAVNATLQDKSNAQTPSQ